MTGLFDRKPEKAVEANVSELCSSKVSEQLTSPLQDTIEVGGVSLSQKPDAPSQAVNLGDIPDLGGDISFGGETSPTDAILELAGDDSVFAVKGVTPHPPAFMAAQVQADYHEELFGKGNIVSVLLRDVCVWSSRYNASKRGERAKLTFNALGSAKEEQFLIEKETKGLLKR